MSETTDNREQLVMTLPDGTEKTLQLHLVLRHLEMRVDEQNARRRFLVPALTGPIEKVAAFLETTSGPE